MFPEFEEPLDTTSAAAVAMLRRNRFGFRMRRRSLTSRLIQILVVLSVLFLFIFFLLYAINLRAESPGPDYSWLKSRNMTMFLRPEVDTTLLEPVIYLICHVIYSQADKPKKYQMALIFYYIFVKIL